MGAKFTKGKWEALITDKHRQLVDIASEKGVIARSFYGDIEPIVTEQEAESNAKLIAAAPDLFKALNSIVLSVKSHPDYVFGKDEDEWHDIISISEKAIKKATE